MTRSEPKLPKSWEDEVQEIMQKAGDLESKSSRSGGGRTGRPGPGIGNPLTALGDQIYKRLATPKDMAVSGALLVAGALLFSITPLGRILSPVLTLVGGILLVGAYVRSLMGNRSTASPGLKMWRGRVIEIEQPRERGFFDRIFGRRHRPK
jgi:hypothetical protein